MLARVRVRVNSLIILCPHRIYVSHARCLERKLKFTEKLTEVSITLWLQVVQKANVYTHTHIFMCVRVNV